MMMFVKDFIEVHGPAVDVCEENHCAVVVMSLKAEPG
jgi:hypothetical protein